MQRTVSTRSVSNGSLGDLNEDLLGDETLVAYSAAAGTTADDGEGRNSPYTAALLAHLEEPVEIGLLFRRVREGVLTATSGRQRPHEYQSLLREHYLSGGGGGGPAAVVAGGPTGSSGAAAAAAGPAAVGSSAVLAQQETVFWQSIVNSTSQADFEAYLARWPAGVYAPLARTRLVALRGAADPPRSNSPSSSDPPDSLAAGSRSVFRDCPDCPELVVIPAGTFRDETLTSFALGRFEVTRAEYAAFVSATGHPGGDRCVTDDGRGNWEWRRRNGASWRDPKFQQGDNHPVVCVSWEDAQSYVAWLRRETGEHYRLPSYAELRYAAGGATRQYLLDLHDQCIENTGDLSLKRQYRRVDPFYGSFASCDDGMVHTAPVGSYEANEFGLFDMLGNVQEWAEDEHCWRGNCRGYRLWNGGSWASTLGNGGNQASTWRQASMGFRVARTLD